MDIRPSLAIPQAGALRLIFDEGQIRAVDANGRKYRLRAEYGTPIHAARATIELTIGTQPTAGNVLTIGATAWTFVAGTPGALEIQIGANLAATQTNVRTKINATTFCTIGAFSANLATVTLVEYGLAGNSVSASITATGFNTFSAAAFSGGADATEGSAGDQLYDGISLYTAVADVNRLSTSGWAAADHS